jgi:hypothetical protein
MNSRRARDLYRRVAQFHEDERLIAWLQSRSFVVWFTPPRRRLLLFVGALFAGVAGVLDRHVDWREYRHAANWVVPAIAFPLLLAIVYSLYLGAVHFKRLPAVVRARPQICAHLFFWVLLLVIWLAPHPAGLGIGVLALIAACFPYLIWRAGYMLYSGQRGKAVGTKFRDHLFYIWPIWDGTNTPPGKGHDNLTRAEALGAQTYARSILAGVKLLVLVLLWKALLQVMAAVVYGDAKSPLTPLLGGYDLGIPRVKQILNGDAAPSLVITWASLYCDLVWESLFLASKGHAWVGIIRLFGFNVFRNTYKPLLAETIVDFWNRYYYYFKELMVEFFFFPTYLRYFRTRPALRIVAAVFAAAFLGNMYYHVLQARRPLVDGDFEALWRQLGARLVYCFLLAIGITLSMLRQQKKRGQTGAAGVPRGGVYRLRRIAGVWTFFAVINFWNVTARITIAERARLFASLLGF